jgi:hypothetical protein
VIAKIAPAWQTTPVSVQPWAPGISTVSPVPPPSFTRTLRAIRAAGGKRRHHAKTHRDSTPPPPSPLRIQTFSLLSLGLEALRLLALGFPAIGFLPCLLPALCVFSDDRLTLRVPLLGFEAFGLETLGFQAFGLETLGFQAFGLETFGLPSLGFEAFGLETLGFLSLGFLSLGFLSLHLPLLGFPSLRLLCCGPFGLESVGLLDRGLAFGFHTLGFLLLGLEPVLLDSDRIPFPRGSVDRTTDQRLCLIRNDEQSRGPEPSQGCGTTRRSDRLGPRVAPLNATA